jgi:hypothetical protein
MSCVSLNSEKPEGSSEQSESGQAWNHVSKNETGSGGSCGLVLAVDRDLAIPISVGMYSKIIGYWKRIIIASEIWD